jgi:hypothetical protein
MDHYFIGTGEKIMPEVLDYQRKRLKHHNFMHMLRYVLCFSFLYKMGENTRTISL